MLIFDQSNLFKNAFEIVDRNLIQRQTIGGHQSNNMATDVNHRSFLRFADEVKREFAFLDSHKFRCVRAEMTFVRFESPPCAINIYHGRRSYEIGLEVEFSQSNDTYSFSEIMRLGKCNQDEQYRRFTANSVNGIATGVHELADRFRKCVDIDILYDERSYFRLKELRKEWIENYALKVELLQARKKSNEAWKKTDFYQFVEVLTPLQEHLSQVESRKFEYARKKIHSTESLLRLRL